MPRALEADYTKTYLLPRAVDDLIPAGHPVRLIREVVDMLDCPELKDKSAPEKAGRPAYSRRLLLRIWIFAYMNRVTSCRKLETMCKEWLPAIWLTGELAPDHNTLWRFWSQEKDLIDKVFEQSLQLVSIISQFSPA